MRKKSASQEFIKYCISSALISLLKEKSYSAISISEICKKAGFGRTTYYRYFNNDKETLILYIAHVMWQERIDRDSERAETDRGRVLLEHVYEHKDFFIILKEQGLDSTLFKILYNEFGRKKDGDFSYVEAFFAGGYFGVIYLWIENNCNDEPEEILKCFFESILLATRNEKNH